MAQATENAGFKLVTTVPSIAASLSGDSDQFVFETDELVTVVVGGKPVMKITGFDFDASVIPSAEQRMADGKYRVYAVNQKGALIADGGHFTIQFEDSGSVIDVVTVTGKSAPTPRANGCLSRPEPMNG